MGIGGLGASSAELMGSRHVPGLELLPVLVSLCGSICAVGLRRGSERGPRRWQFMICSLVCKLLRSKAVWGAGGAGQLWVVWLDLRSQQNGRGESWSSMAPSPTALLESTAIKELFSLPSSFFCPDSVTPSN